MLRLVILFLFLHGYFIFSMCSMSYNHTQVLNVGHEAILLCITWQNCEYAVLDILIVNIIKNFTLDIFQILIFYLDINYLRIGKYSIFLEDLSAIFQFT